MVRESLAYAQHYMNRSTFCCFVHSFQHLLNCAVSATPRSLSPHHFFSNRNPRKLKHSTSLWWDARNGTIKYIKTCKRCIVSSFGAWYWLELTDGKISSWVTRCETIFSKMLYKNSEIVVNTDEWFSICGQNSHKIEEPRRILHTSLTRA